MNCSPPNTVIGIETCNRQNRFLRSLQIAALLIPSSVLKPSNLLVLTDGRLYCSPPNTVIGIETIVAEVVEFLIGKLQPS